MNCEEEEMSSTNASPLSLLPNDRTALISSPNSTQFIERLAPFGYPSTEFSPNDPTTVADKAWGICAWLTQSLRLSAGFEVFCIILFCLLIATIWWFWVERPRRLLAARQNSESGEPMLDLKNCCHLKQHGHESDQSSVVQQQKDEKNVPGNLRTQSTPTQI